MEKHILIYLLMFSGPIPGLQTVLNMLNAWNWRGVMTFHVCIHFSGREIAKVTLTSFLEPLPSADTKDKSSSHTAYNQATAGEDLRAEPHHPW
jgi:hypothetical protein